MRHEYSGATTRRYLEWLTQRDGWDNPPSLCAIEDWLRGAEKYGNPLAALRGLCGGLREGGYTTHLHHIACQLAFYLQGERDFSRKVEDFFRAVESRREV
jgi:hypothetical protein